MIHILKQNLQEVEHFVDENEAFYTQEEYEMTKKDLTQKLQLAMMPTESTARN